MGKEQRLALHLLKQPKEQIGFDSSIIGHES
jgi:hypothetical protein